MNASKITLALLATGLLATALPATAGGKKKSNPCRQTTSILVNACRLESTEDRETARAVCLNESDETIRETCLDDADEGYDEARSACEEVRDARFEVCAVPSLEGRYDPEIVPANFVADITNPYAPFTVGSTWRYESETDAGLETIEIEVLEETKEVLGVTCTVVRDTVKLDGVLVEDTLDYLAQDVDGNVWYFGELSQSFEDGVLHDLDGSFTAGVDGAKPGFWMKAAPVSGEIYRQEWFVGEAEDMAEVTNLDSPVSVPFDNGGAVREIREFTPLDPGNVEFKYFVPGIGLVLETKPGSTERLELVEFNP